MAALLGIVALVLSLAGFVCGIIILVDAFKNEWWKGLLCLVTCGLYMLYYAFVEFQNQNKWVIVGVWIGAGLLSGALRVVAMSMLPH